ncbi:MAG: hypothetical protein V7K62_24375 [Nostoc sp.]
MIAAQKCIRENFSPLPRACSSISKIRLMDNCNRLDVEPSENTTYLI